MQSSRRDCSKAISFGFGVFLVVKQWSRGSWSRGGGPAFLRYVHLTPFVFRRPLPVMWAYFTLLATRNSSTVTPTSKRDSSGMQCFLSSLAGHTVVQPCLEPLVVRTLRLGPPLPVFRPNMFCGNCFYFHHHQYYYHAYCCHIYNYHSYCYHDDNARSPENFRTPPLPTTNRLIYAPATALSPFPNAELNTLRAGAVTSRQLCRPGNSVHLPRRRFRRFPRTVVPSLFGALLHGFLL